jgi:TolB-like protein/Tfp pilus assembly protein PilF
MPLFEELKRRNVLRVAASYAAVSWLVIQVIETLFPVFGLSDAAIRIVVALLVIGFVPALVLSWAFELTPDGFKREEEVDHDSAVSRRMTRRLDRLLLSALVLALGLFAVDKFVLDPARDAAELATATEQAREEGRNEAKNQVRKISVAVLAFQDLSPEGDQQYFCDGLSVDLLNQLSRNPELRVTGKTSAFSFKGKDVTIPEIGEVLNVGHVLDGTISKSGDRIRISVQFVDAGSGTNVWSKTYDRTLDDIFTIRDEITDTIVRELQTELGGLLPRSPRTDSRTYELTLQARYISDRTDSVEDLEHAAELVAQALAIDPNYVPALLEAVFVNWSLMNHGLMDETEQRRKALELLNRVLAIDPDNGNALMHLAWGDWEVRMDLDAAAAGFARALATEPGDSDVLRAAGIFARSIGRHDQSVHLIERCMAADPLNLRCVSHLGRSYLWANRLDEAVILLDRFETLRGRQTAFRYTVMIRLLQGEPTLALDELEAAGDWSESPQGLAAFAMIAHDLGRRDDSAAALAQLIARWPDVTRAEAYLVPEAYAWTGDTDAAFEWLEKAVEVDDRYGVRGFWFNWIVFLPTWRNLHDDPRWKGIRERIGISEERLAAIEFNVR